MAALGELLGLPAALAALTFLNAVYPTDAPQTTATQFAEACEAEPADLAAVPLDRYKGLKPPLVDWTFVAHACQRLGRALLKQELSASLPSTVDAAFEAEESP